MAKIKIDTQKLNKNIQKSFDVTIERFSQALDDAITAEIYDYPRTTKRRNTEIAGSPRNIVDTGELLDSKVISRSSSGNEVEFSWDVDYAIQVYEGYATNRQNVVPPRRWGEKALEEINPGEVFEQQMRRYL